VTALDELAGLIPPPDEPPAPVAWDGDYPADYRALVERYGAANLGGLQLLVPGHENRYLDLLRQIKPQRAALPADGPYPPERLLPWGIDEAGNVVWWLTDGDWPVVANEARGFEWYRYEGGAVTFLVAILSGRESSDFLTVEL
jgi:hypothetical protein